MPGFAKAGVWGPVPFQNSQGVELSGTLTVYTDSARTIKAALYTDQTAATAAPNPVSPDTLGNFTVYATPGLYYGTFTHGGTSTNTLVTVVSAGAGAPGFSVLDYGAKGDGVTDDTTAVQAAITAAAASGGTVFFPTGTFLVSSTLTLTTGVSFVGAGRGASTIKAAVSLTTNLIGATVLAGGSIHDILIKDLTLDGNSTPSGTIRLINLDTSANVNILYYNITCERVNFQNGLMGWSHAANNVNGGTNPNQTRLRDCFFKNLAEGVIVGGSYATSVEYCFFTGCTVAAVCTNSARTSPANGGTGPTACMTVDGCHIEGSGNFATPGAEDGIQIAASDSRVTNCMILGVGSFPIWFQTGEVDGGSVSDCHIWGSGFSGCMVLGQNATNDSMVVTNVNCVNVAKFTGGFSQNQAAFQAGAGNIMFQNCYVGETTTFPPKYALSVGASGTPARVIVDGLHCPAVAGGGSYLNVIATPSVMFKVANSAGYNPFGVVSPGVPASGSPVAAVPYDRTFYVSTVAGTTSCSMAIASGPTVPFIASTAQVVAVFVPAGLTVTPTYTGTAPTWVVEGN